MKSCLDSSLEVVRGAPAISIDPNWRKAFLFSKKMIKWLEGTTFIVLALSGCRGGTLHLGFSWFRLGVDEMHRGFCRVSLKEPTKIITVTKLQPLGSPQRWASAKANKHNGANVDWLDNWIEQSQWSKHYISLYDHPVTHPAPYNGKWSQHNRTAIVTSNILNISRQGSSWSSRPWEGT